jgi:hypothetical protein
MALNIKTGKVASLMFSIIIPILPDGAPGRENADRPLPTIIGRARRNADIGMREAPAMLLE